MLSKIKITINNILNWRTKNTGRITFIAFIFLFIFIGLTVPNPNKADALFWIPFIIAAAVIGGNTAIGDPTGIQSNILGGVGNAVGGVVGGAVGGLLDLLLAVLGTVSQWLVELAGQFLTFILVDFTQTVSFYNNSMVNAGWSVVRDISNWFFIIMLIVIAIGTIIGQEQYNVKRRIIPLVIVAIFMNFSLFFVALYINVTQLFMSFFINKLTSPYQDIGKAIAFSGLGFGQEKGYSLLPGSSTNALATNFFVVIFQFFAAFVLLLIAILLIVRVAQLWFHMIMAPLAFVSTLIPRTQQFFGQWMQGLITWGLFGVFASFFIWLSTYLIAYLDPLSNPNAPGINVQLVGDANALPGLAVANIFLRFVTVSMFLMAGMHVAKSMSGRAGAMASDGIMRVAGMAAAPGLAAGAIAARGGRRIAARELQDRTYARREKLVGQLERMPLVGSGLSAPFRAGLRGEEVKVKQKYEDVEKELSAGGPKAVQSLTTRLASSGLAMDRSERAAIIMSLSKRNALSEEMREKYYEGAFKHLYARGTEATIAGADQERARKILATLPKRDSKDKGPRGEVSADQLVEEYKLHMPQNAKYLPAYVFDKDHPRYDAKFTDAILARINGNGLSQMASDNPITFSSLIRSINQLNATELKGISANRPLIDFLTKSPVAMGAGVDAEKLQLTLGRLVEKTGEGVVVTKDQTKEMRRAANTVSYLEKIKKDREQNQ